VSVFQSRNELAETPALFQSVSEIRRTCSLNNAPEIVQPRNFFSAQIIFERAFSLVNLTASDDAWL
jgi:hypothetical protein